MSTSHILNRPLPEHDSGNVGVPYEVSRQLPYPAGYTPGHLASDLVAAFQDPPSQPHGLHEIVQAWESRALQKNQSPMGLRRTAASYYRSLHRLRRSPLRQWLLDRTGGEPVAAAQTLLDLLARKTDGQVGGGDSMAAGLSALMGSARKGLDLPFAPPNEGADGGEGAGTGHGGLAARTFRVAELVRRLSLRYEPYARRTAVSREVPWPDDIDVIPLRSYGAGDITRVCLMDHIMSTPAEFAVRLARRQVRQTIYQEPDPAPRHFVILLDVSGSMEEECGYGYTREEYAIASAICLLRSALAGGNRVTFIRFDGEPYPPLEGTPAQVVDQILRMEFSGRGTDIGAALQGAARHEPDEIILITDGDEEVRDEARPQSPLVSYLAGLDHPTLRKWSRSYTRVESSLA